MTAVTQARHRALPPDRMRAEPAATMLAVDAGVLAYGEAWAWQRELVERRTAGGIGDVLITLEHPAVYTHGRRADPVNLVYDAAERAARGIELFEVDRGGDFTYHGPGQLVGYPIVQLASIRGVVDYVRALEEVCIRVAGSYGLDAGRVEGLTGVWIGDEKLVAIGVRVSARGVTQHGFAMNVTTDLDDFSGIVPCGIADRGVCSLRSLGVDTTMAEARDRVRREFGLLFGVTLQTTSPDDLGRTR